jgi:hypothetical protein
MSTLMFILRHPIMAWRAIRAAKRELDELEDFLGRNPFGNVRVIRLVPPVEMAEQPPQPKHKYEVN